MYLSRLHIVGFKSFANKTTIDFHDGITAIVGPNGCGKSNIVDAIRWVLGEQKAGTLRSENMQNVIFNGTRNRRSLGMSEVALTILNNRNILPIEFSEVVLTRRLFRSGESQYLLNNAVCRLKDIVDLFLDTGMGANAYSVIELPMVEKLLNGRPEERRQIFEEAAGVTKYKIRRKSAFRKLEATEQDLIRLSDILSEVEKSVNSLRRQVNKARRYRDMSKELRDLELDYSAYHLNIINNELLPLTEKASTLQVDKERLTSEIRNEEAKIDEKAKNLAQIERELYEFRTKMHANSDLIQKKEEEILVSQERVRSSEHSRDRAENEIKELTIRLASLDDEKADATFQLSETKERVEHNSTQLTSENQKLASIKDAFLQEKAEEKKLENQRLSLLARIGSLQQDQQKITTQLEYSVRHVDASRAETKALKEKQETAGERRNALSTQKHELDDTAYHIDEQETRFNGELESEKDAIENTKKSILEIERHMNNREDRAQLLRNFLNTYEDYPEGIRHLLLDKKDLCGAHGTVGDVIAVDDKYRKAIESALGESAASLIVNEAEDARKAIDILLSDGKGAVTFMPASSFAQDTDSAPAFPPHHKKHILKMARECVRVSEEHTAILDVLLHNVAIVEDLDTAMDVARNMGDMDFLLTTLAGELVSSKGFIRGGESASSDMSLVGRKALVEELENEYAVFSDQLASLEEKLRKHEINYRGVLAELEKLKKHKVQIAAELKSVEISLGEAKLDERRNNERLLTVSDETGKLQTEIAVLQEKKTALDPSLIRYQAEKAAIEEKIVTFQTHLLQEEAKVVENENRVKELHLNFVTSQTEYKNFQQALDRLQRAEEEIGATTRRRKEEINTSEMQIADLNDRIDELRYLLQKDFAAQKEIEDHVQGIEKKHQELKQETEAQENSLKNDRRKRDAISDDLHGAELRVSELKMNHQNILEQMQETYELDLREHPVPEKIDTAGVAARINELKQKLRVMGPVNMLALKDYEVEKERLDFLHSQRDDLLRAEENLKETIKVINDTAHTRFNEVFKKVRTNFIEVFASFFENGQADLRLADDDPLSAEIIIEANPKGKKLGSLALLSGGEKTLTAISILFAIYLVKPSPFCILDEVDAPLDDVNVGRFTAALESFSNRTQFIVVTHNKLTMSAARQLYGITMEEQGVSKVVSVQFDKMDPSYTQGPPTAGE